MNLTSNVFLMKKALDMFKGFDGDGIIRLSPDRMRIQVADVTNAMFIDMNAEKSSFISYHCDKQRDIVINISNMRDALQRLESSDVLIMEIPDDGNTVIFHIIKRERKKVLKDRRFVLPIVINDKIQIKDLDFSHPDTFEIPSKLMKTAFSDMQFSANRKGLNTLMLKATKDTIRFVAGSQESVKTKVEYHKSELKSINISEKRVVYLNLRFVEDVLKGMNDDLILKVYIGTDVPVRIDCKVADIKLNLLAQITPITFKMFLAPIIGDNKFEDYHEEGEQVKVGEELESQALDSFIKQREEGVAKSVNNGSSNSALSESMNSPLKDAKTPGGE